MALIKTRSAIAPEIELPDTNGNIIKLSSLRGKIVLIDFGHLGAALQKRKSEYGKFIPNLP